MKAGTNYYGVSAKERYKEREPQEEEEFSGWSTSEPGLEKSLLNSLGWQLA